MKKTIFFLAGCALALTGCTSTEVQEEGVQSNAIGFQYVVGKESRAVDNTTLKKFQVYGYYVTPDVETNTAVNVFNGTEVYKLDAVDENTQSQWAYEGTRYWVPGMTYYFYAYCCEDGAFATNKGEAKMDLGGDNPNTNTRALQFNNFVCDKDHQHDLVIAASDPIVAKVSGNNKVAFKFNHVLTRLNVVFSSEFAPGYNIKIINASLKRFCDRGDYKHLPAPEWSEVKYSVDDQANIVPVPFAIPANANVASAKNGEVAEKKVTTGYIYAIPWNYPNGDTVEINFEIEVESETGETVLKRNLSGTWSPNWAIGTSYTYNIKITGTAAKLEPIVFETAENMNDWSAGTTSGIEMAFSAN